MTLPKSKLQIDVPFEDLERRHHHLLSITADSKFNYEGSNRVCSVLCYSDDFTAPTKEAFFYEINEIQYEIKF